MSDLIDRKKLYNYLNDWAFGIAPDERHEGTERLIRQVRYETIQECMSAVEELPSAERTGGWEVYAIGRYTCSCCNFYSHSKSNYCPNCGADMKGEDG